VPVISAIGHETDFTIADFVADLRAPTPSAAAELVIATKQELLNRIAERTRVLTQVLRLKLALLGKRVQTQGAERSEAMLHRAINRRFQVLDDKDARMRAALRRMITGLSVKRVTLEQRLRYFDVRPKLERDRNRLDTLHAGELRAMERLIAGKKRRWENGLARLEQLSPLRVLERGYAIVQKKSGGVLKDPAAAEPGTALEIRLAGGTLEAESK